MDSSPKDSNTLIKRILAYTGEDGFPYIDRYNKAWVLNAIDELNVIKSLETQFRIYDSQGLGLDLIDFIKALLSIISHEQDETLYLTIGAVDLHRDICETFGLKDRVKASDVVNYTIENFVNKEWRTHVIPTKKLPEKKKFGDNVNQIREIDINAPIVFGNSSGGIMRLINSKMVTDSQRHNNDTLNRVYFSAEVKRLFTLDSASGSISMYNINGGLEKKIAPKASDDAEEIIILDFAWSHKQQRIGASLKDFTLIFWDFSDKFEFEMIVPIRKWVSEYQTNIWYLDFMNLWVTTDKSHQLNVWNIDKEVKHFNLTSPRLKSSIIDVIAIDLLKLVAVSTMDKIIMLWDLRKRSMVLEMDLTHTSVHTMVWSNTYQVLITAGYESKINLWSINPLYLDYTLIGKLEGHNSTITAIAIIEGTSMLVSVDDQWKIKTWDLRNLKCVQTLDMEAKVFVTKIIDMYAYNKLCFISSRINFLEFDRVSMEVAHKGQGQDDGDSIWPINVEYNFMSNELMVGTRKDIRFIDLGSGRTKKLYEGLLNNEEDDITAFRLIHQDKKFILGDQRGRLGLYSYATGEKMKTLVGQSEEINGLKVDVVNKMVMTSSWDNTIHIQKESNMGYELKRTVKNIHYNRETSILEMSVFHNLFVTATNSNILYVWDYEFMKVMGMIELEEEAEPTCVSFINGDSSLILADSSGLIHLIRFKRKEFSRVYFERKGVIKIPNPMMDNELFVNRILVDIDTVTGQFGESENKVRMYAATNKGEVLIYDLSEFVQEDLSQVIAQAGPKGNYKSDRIVNEDFLTQVNTYRIYTYSVKEGKNGVVLTESETQSANMDTLLMDNCMVGEFQAHKDTLTTLIAMVSPNRKILTSSLDGFVKIWTVDGGLLASLNINHPLPILWDIKNDDSMRNQTKIVNALKMIDMIVQQPKVKNSDSEKKKFSIDKFLKKFVQAEDESDLELIEKKPVTKKRTVIQQDRKEKVLLMKDEYSPRDFQFSKAKEVFKRELQGPTLRQLDVAQKLTAIIQKVAMERPLNKGDPFDEEDHIHSFRREREKEYENSKKLKGASEMALSKRTKLLEKKLEKISLISNNPKRSLKKGSLRKSIESPGKKYQSKVLDEVLYTTGKLTSEHHETMENYEFPGKRTMSIQIGDARDKVKLIPIKLPARDGTMSLTASQRDLNPSGKVSFRESDVSRKLGKDEYPSKSARLIEEKVKKQDFTAVASKLDAILKKPYSPSMLLKDFGKRVGSVSTRALNVPNGRSSTQTMMDIEAKSPRKELGIKQNDRVVSFDRFKSKKNTMKYHVEVQSPKKKKTSEASSPKNVGKDTEKRAFGYGKEDMIKSVNNSGIEFETLENTFAGMSQFLGKMNVKKPYFADLGSMKAASPRMKGNKPILIMQKSKKGDASPMGFE